MKPMYSVALVTVPSREAADKLAKGLVEARLAACVNILPGVTSVYRWKGAVETSEELLLIAKTRTTLLPELIEFVKENHEYSVPETIAMHVDDGNETYLDWLGANTRFTRRRQTRVGFQPDSPPES